MAKNPPQKEKGKHFQFEGLILAQSERWRRGLGMQVERPHTQSNLGVG